MLVAKSVFKLIFVLSNYQTCTFPLNLLIANSAISRNMLLLKLNVNFQYHLLVSKHIIQLRPFSKFSSANNCIRARVSWLFITMFTWCHHNWSIDLLKTSRVYCWKRRDQTGSFQSHHSFKREFTHGYTRKFTIHIYIYSLLLWLIKFGCAILGVRLSVCYCVVRILSGVHVDTCILNYLYIQLYLIDYTSVV